MRQSNDNWVTVSCTIERETPKAFLIETEDREEHWVPKSQSQKVPGGLRIKEWLVQKNDIMTGHHQMLAESRPDDFDEQSGDWEPVDPHDDIPF